jgi:hypothetical protein
MRREQSDPLAGSARAPADGRDAPGAGPTTFARPPAFAAGIPDISLFLPQCADVIVETFFLMEEKRSWHTRIFQDL